MTFSSIKLFMLRLMTVSSFCLLLCNCGNKSALFLDSSEQIENTEINKLIKSETDSGHSEEGSNSKGEKTP